MSYKYPDSSNDPNIYADDRTSSYYSSKADVLASKYSQSDDIFSILFVKYLSSGSNILDIGCGTRFSSLTKDTRETLFSAFSETVEISAEQRGVERWKG